MRGTPFAFLALGIAFGSISGKARAEVYYQIQPSTPAEDSSSIEIDPLTVRDLNTEQWQAYAQTVAETWVRQHLSPPTTPSGSSNPDPVTTSKLVVQILHFARDVSSDSDSFNDNFRAQLLHAISGRTPGFAWVVVADKSGFDLNTLVGYREGGGLGVQIPIYGTDTLWLKRGQGQLVLRLMPLSGNIEKVQVGAPGTKRAGSSEDGLVIRPSAEAEASLHWRILQPGIRLLVQPRLTDPSQVRMLAEVYANIDFQTDSPIISKVSIVPRCVVDMSTDRQHPKGENAALFTRGYDLLNSNRTCSISGEFAFGL